MKDLKNKIITFLFPKFYSQFKTILIEIVFLNYLFIYLFFFFWLNKVKLSKHCLLLIDGVFERKGGIFDVLYAGCDCGTII